jgi:NDP-sugar pyrophosphorylase family protein
MTSYDAVILAGGVNSGELRKYAPYENEALIILGKYPMIHYVYQAVKNTPG